ncbi:hypothetical protein Tco_1335341 [Tanacetum coccineum]
MKREVWVAAVPCRGGGDVTAVVTAVVVWSWHGRGDYGDEGGGDDAVVRCGGGGEMVWRWQPVKGGKGAWGEQHVVHKLGVQLHSRHQVILDAPHVIDEFCKTYIYREWFSLFSALEVGFSVLNPDMSSLYLSYLHGRHAKKRLEVVLDPRFGATSDPSISVS